MNIQRETIIPLNHYPVAGYKNDKTRLRKDQIWYPASLDYLLSIACQEELVPHLSDG